MDAAWILLHIVVPAIIGAIIGVVGARALTRKYWR